MLIQWGCQAYIVTSVELEQMGGLLGAREHIFPYPMYSPNLLTWGLWDLYQLKSCFRTVNTDRGEMRIRMQWMSVSPSVAPSRTLPGPETPLLPLEHSLTTPLGQVEVLPAPRPLAGCSSQ